MNRLNSIIILHQYYKCRTHVNFHLIILSIYLGSELYICYIHEKYYIVKLCYDMANVKEFVMEGDFCEVKKWFVIPFLVTLIFFLGADLNKADEASVSQLESVSKKYLGVKYKYGGTSVSTGFDC